MDAPAVARPNQALVAARKALGYSQRGLAARVRAEGLQRGLPAPSVDAIYKQVYRLERGTTARPGEDFYLPTLCAVLGRSPSELFGVEPASTEVAYSTAVELLSVTSSRSGRCARAGPR